MRQTLFRIWLEKPWAWWTEQVGEPPLLGAGWVLVIAGSLIFLYYLLQSRKEFIYDTMNWLTWGAGLFLVSVAGPMGFLPKSIPLFGYGAMVLIGFVTGLAYATRRAKQVGYNPEHVMDVAFWLLIFGIVGGRTAYLVQYGGHIFQRAKNLPEALYGIINLAEGGLVLIGALAGGTLGFAIFCWLKRLNVFEFLDIIMPAVFIGIGFGRIGCLLNGCCFGDRCDLPWGITFPNGSVTFQILADRGFVDPEAPATMLLHPTQIYSAINGFILALVTSVFYWYRRYPGDVFALSCILYPLTRIQLEVLRADEMGQLGTGLTISQIYSLIILVCGVILLALGPYREKLWQFSMPDKVLAKK